MSVSAAAKRISSRFVVVAALTITIDAKAEALQPVPFHVDNLTEQPGKYVRTWKQFDSDGSGVSTNVEAHLTSPAGYATAFTVYMDPWHFTNSTTQHYRRFTVRIDMNNDGNWEINTTRTGFGTQPIYASWNYPVPAYLTSAQHTIRFDVAGYDISGNLIVHVSGTTPVCVVPNRDWTYRTSSRYSSALTGYLSPDGVLDRPLVIVEGFDALNRDFAPELFVQVFPVLQSMSVSAGYDVFVYNFENGGRKMEENAMGLLGALVRLHQDTPSVKTKVVGLSMGGVVARYALAWAENSQLPGNPDTDTYHSCDTFISFDAPQQGAWVNTDLQTLIKNNEGLEGLKDFATVLKSDAAKQLLRHNVYDPPPPPTHGNCVRGGQQHEAFFTGDLDALNGNGFPKNTFNIALSNAHGNISSKTIYGAQDETYAGVPMLTATIGGVTLGVVDFQIQDLYAGSLQPAYRENPASTRLSRSLLWGFITFGVDVDLTFHDTTRGNFIWANSALDLCDIVRGSNGVDIVDWDDSRFHEIHVADNPGFFHDEVPWKHKHIVLDEIDAIGLTYPDGNETVFVDSAIDVRWHNTPGLTYTSHVISYLEHTDSTYVELATVGGAAESATVRIPIVQHTTQSRMRLVSHLTDGTTRTDVSDHDFTTTLGFTDYTDSWLRQGDVYGVAWADYDLDGDQDLCRLYDYGIEFLLNDGNGRMWWASQGHIGMCNNPRSAAWADYDNDGYLDLYVGCDDANMLLTGFGPHGTGFDSAVAPINDTGWARGVSWGDYDTDGDVDIFVANANTTNKLFRNDGAWSWTDASSQIAGQVGDDTQGGYWGDYDRDRDPDLFVANLAAPDVLYTNNGDGTFSSQTMTQAGNTQSQSADWVDYDNDLDLDLYVVKAYGTDLLFENQGDGTFLLVDRGIGGTSAERDYMCTWRDVDNFAWQDPYVVSELGDRTYSNTGYSGTPGFLFIGSNGWAGSDFGRVAVSADIDNDGRVDMYVGEKKGVEGHNWLLRNNVAYPGAKWLEIDLEATSGNRAGIGSQIEVRTAHPGGGQRTLLREVRSGTGFQSAAPLRQHFGLAEASEAYVRVRWSTGFTSNHYVGNVNRIITIVEPPPPSGGGGCPYVWVDDGDGFEVANTVLAPVARSAAGLQASNVHDTYHVQIEPEVIDGRYELEIREFEREHSYFDSIQLFAVDHPEGSSLVVDHDGSLSLRSVDVTPAVRATEEGLGNVTGLLAVADGEVFTGEPGDVVTLTFPAGVALDDWILVIGESKILDNLPQGRSTGGPITAGIEVLVRNPATSELVSLGAVRPRELSSETYIGGGSLLANVPLESDVEVRLVWHTRHALDHVSWTQPFDGELEAALLPLARAEHVAGTSTTRVDVLERLSATDGSFAELVPGESILLSFVAALAPQPGERSFVLELEGHYVRLETVTTAPSSPIPFGLLAARPNPFNPRTTIGLAMPTAAPASLRVYGLDGRLVRSLVDGRLDAGRHEFVWDGRDDGGRAQSSGVYFYRLESPLGTETRRMTLLK